MAREIRSFTATITAGTLKTAPLTVPMLFPTRIVTEIEITVPPGPNGEVGFAIANSGVIIIPYNPNEFVVVNDKTINWQLHDFIDSGSWQLIAYNTGRYNHQLQVRFLLDLVPERVPVNIAGTVANSAITPSAGLPTQLATSVPTP
jgi:hypothetical protein